MIHPVTDLAMPLIFFIKFSFREECQEFLSTPNMDKTSCLIKVTLDLDFVLSDSVSTYTLMILAC